MKLTILGCSGTVPGPDSPASGYLVEHEGFRLLLDLGQGALGALQRFARPEQIDALLVSHLHPDHFIDMTGLATYLRWGPARLYRRLPVIGPVDTEARLSAACGDPGHPNDLSEIFDFRTPTDGELGPFQLDFARMRHPIACDGVRISAGGRSLVYSGDTGPTKALVTLARDADLLLCEAALEPGQVLPELHLTGREAGEHAAAAGVGRLIVTHVPPWVSRTQAADEAQQTFDGPVTAAQPDAGYEL
ncbi:ribonuclease BN (tRNA processing enzyme) [Jatrophihabitans sp. GAS493]|uniref:MBL fold metallo-hydrolase n=1 Tax=Jatrophihabitans sp. GAS493 TaxID=1907575 RepID=UPI000BB78462|nr:MBL fold metallo-hydrolase [Jatrophihabitans sp. GAS493]SOD72646.1 ribonuclease BN (tRNA processing enzyme) [Jatrophihabitans sp. GAS493]